jgi:anti-sigma factor RsiW
MNNCQDLEPLLAPYVDGEATAEQRAVIEAHLAKCLTCREYAEAETHARELLRACRDQLQTPAPARLHQKCADIARREAQERAAREAQTRRRPAPVGWQRWAPLSLVATIVLAVVAVFAYGVLSPRGTALAAQLVADHVRCATIVGDRAPNDPSVSSTDWKTRRGWFVKVPVFADADHLQFVQLRRCFHGQRVEMAHVVYRRDGRLLSLFIMPEHESASPGEIDAMGQRTSIWSQGGRTYAVVGANSTEELQELVDRFHRAVE